jgi:Uma2 family endonuclease
MRERYELNAFGEMVVNGCPSGTRQLAFTDIYCRLADQMGHLAAMSVPVVTASFGIRVPDVVWMAPEKWECFDRDGPVPFVPDLCVEVLLDSDLPREIGRRVASYLEGGAKEVVVVSQDGAIEFWGAKGRRQASTFAITLSVEPVLLPSKCMVSAVDLHHRAAERTAAAIRDAGRWGGAVLAEAGNR